MSWERVYRLVKRIPRGRVLTYGELARALRLRGGARAAGHAMAACPSGRGIPWHRVVGAGGWIKVREPYATLQRQLLVSEGTRCDGLRVDLKRHHWRMAGHSRQRSRPKPPQKKKQHSTARSQLAGSPKSML